jgi:outer membrane protein assembly factor BamB
VLYVSTLGHHLLAVDVTQAGKVLWTFNAGGAIAGSPVLDGNTLYVGAFDNQLYAIDAQTGQKKWSYDTHAWVWDAAVVFKDRVYVGDLGGHVQALDAADGKPLWSQPATVDGAVRANPLYTGEVLLVVTEKGSVYALDPGNGSIRWVARAANARFLTRPLVDNDALLLATLSGPVQLYGVDMAAVPEFYQKQEVGAEGRLPVALYLQDKPNPDVVRWVFSTQSK